MDCPKCKHNLIWGGDHTYDDYGMDDGDGIVSNYSCHNDECDVDTIIIYTKFDDEV
jgi:hypothetical protein